MAPLTHIGSLLFDHPRRAVVEDFDEILDLTGDSIGVRDSFDEPVYQPLETSLHRGFREGGLFGLPPLNPLVPVETPVYQPINHALVDRDKVQSLLQWLIRNPNYPYRAFVDFNANPDERKMVMGWAVLALASEHASLPRLVLGMMMNDLPFEDRYQLYQIAHRANQKSKTMPSLGADTQLRFPARISMWFDQYMQEDYERARREVALYRQGAQVQGKKIGWTLGGLMRPTLSTKGESVLVLRPGVEAYVEGLSLHNELFLIAPLAPCELFHFFVHVPVLKRAFTGMPAHDYVPNHQWGFKHRVMGLKEWKNLAAYFNNHQSVDREEGESPETFFSWLHPEVWQKAYPRLALDMVIHDDPVTTRLYEQRPSTKTQSWELADDHDPASAQIGDLARAIGQGEAGGVLHTSLRFDRSFRQDSLNPQYWLKEEARRRKVLMGLLKDRPLVHSFLRRV